MTQMVTTDAVTLSPAETALLVGDLSKLQPDDRANLYLKICESTGLNPYTRPFEYIVLNGKMVLYARKDATDQLRAIHKVSVVIASRGEVEGVYVVTSRATLPSGRTDESIGAVSIKGQGGEALCNSLMKAETKSKRRVTLSICGLGILDESELETISGATPFVEGPSATVVTEPKVLPIGLEPKPPALVAKTAAQLKELFDQTGIPVAFKDWLTEEIAQDLPQRKKQALFPSESLEAERRLNEILAGEKRLADAAITEATLSEPASASDQVGPEPKDPEPIARASAGKKRPIAGTSVAPLIAEISKLARLLDWTAEDVACHVESVTEVYAADPEDPSLFVCTTPGKRRTVDLTPAEAQRAIDGMKDELKHRADTAATHSSEPTLIENAAR